MILEDASVLGALRVDPGGRRAFLGTRELRLRVKLFDLLSALARQPNIAVSRESLMQQVWHETWYSSSKTLDAHIAELRRVLLDAASVSGVTAPQIVTQRGFGFRLEPAKA